MQNVQDWIKNTIVGRKNTAALFVVGPRESGKTLFANTLAEYVADTTYPKFRKSRVFNADLIGPSLVVFDEWSIDFEEIKPLVTNDQVFRYSKGEAEELVHNPSNYLFLLSKSPTEPMDQRRMILTNPGVASIALLNVVSDD